VSERPESVTPDEPLPNRLARAITLAGPIPVAHFMAAANTHYYATHDPFGVAGDFITAPEISQMFGELVGLWLADLWDRAGRPKAHYVELGPGRGTLASDALRAMATAGLTPQVHFVETSPVLRVAQAELIPDATWHEDVSSLPGDAALLIVANEFFDALPIYQLIKAESGWHERLVVCQDTLFLPIAGKALPDTIIPETLVDAPSGSIIETSPTSVAIAEELAKRITAQGGAAIVIDYGYDGPALGETFQAVRGHAYANPFDAPGEQDLTAHVDFATLCAAARRGGAAIHGPVAQGDWLTALGIADRAAALAQASPVRAGEIEAARHRLTAANEMGRLFRAMALTSSDWPLPVMDSRLDAAC
jgi:NADH dehydrogenase [ubiquinone] 1 alpha subcomplex assembly factor 7